MKKPRYSLVVPIYNDAYLARDFCAVFDQVFRGADANRDLRETAELIFVNDGSEVDSTLLLRQLFNEYRFVKVVELSRNFGQHIAIACGFKEARGDFVGRTNVDMQDPLAEIMKMIEVLETSDADIVVGTYKNRASSWQDRLTAYLFYRFFNWLTGQKTPQNTSSLRLMSRRYIDAYNSLTEKTRFPQGLDNWLGFNQRYIEIEHRDRSDGKSSYTFKGRLKLAVDAALSFSEKPLALIFWLGTALIAFGVIYSVYLATWRLLSPDPIPGYASLLIFFLLLFGIQNLCIGVIAQYIGKILLEAQNRPLFVVKERHEHPSLGDSACSSLEAVNSP